MKYKISSLEMLVHLKHVFYAGSTYGYLHLLASTQQIIKNTQTRKQAGSWSFAIRSRSLEQDEQTEKVSFLLFYFVFKSIPSIQL